MKAFDEEGLILSRQVELDLDALDDEMLEVHAARFFAFLKVAKVDSPLRIEHEVNVPPDVRERLVAAARRAQRWANDA